MFRDFSQSPTLTATYDDPGVQKKYAFATAAAGRHRAGASARPVSPVYPQISQAIYKNVNEALAGRASAGGRAEERRRPRCSRRWRRSDRSWLRPASVPAGHARRRRSRGIPERRLAWLMTTPVMLLIALVAVWPIIYAIWLSMHEYSLDQGGRVALGLTGRARQLHRRVPGRRVPGPRLCTTFVFTIASVILETLLGLAMALIMATAFKGQGLLRTVVLVPWAVLTVVTAIMWQDDLRPEPRVREPVARHQHRLARRGATGADRDDHRRRLEDRAVHGAAAARRPPGHPVGDLRGGEGRRRDGVAAVPADHAAAADAGAARRADLPHAGRAADRSTCRRCSRTAPTGRRRLSLLAQRTFQENRLYGEGAAISIITFIIVMLVSFAYIRLVGGNIRGMTEDR